MKSTPKIFLFLFSFLILASSASAYIGLRYDSHGCLNTYAYAGDTVSCSIHYTIIKNGNGILTTCIYNIDPYFAIYVAKPGGTEQCDPDAVWCNDVYVQATDDVGKTLTVPFTMKIPKEGQSEYAGTGYHYSIWNVGIKPDGSCSYEPSIIDSTYIEGVGIRAPDTKTPGCGNGACESSSETCSNCPTDCGACPTATRGFEISFLNVPTTLVSGSTHSGTVRLKNPDTTNTQRLSVEVGLYEESVLKAWGYTFAIETLAPKPPNCVPTETNVDTYLVKLGPGETGDLKYALKVPSKAGTYRLHSGSYEKCWSEGGPVFKGYYSSQIKVAVVSAVCGNGNPDAGEECDDGNTNDGDGCSASCKLEVTACNKNGTCDNGESFASCPEDCPSRPIVEVKTECNNNDVCDSNEDKRVCPSDCDPARKDFLQCGQALDVELCGAKDSDGGLAPKCATGWCFRTHKGLGPVVMACVNYGWRGGAMLRSKRDALISVQPTLSNYISKMSLLGSIVPTTYASGIDQLYIDALCKVTPLSGGGGNCGDICGPVAGSNVLDYSGESFECKPQGSAVAGWCKDVIAPGNNICTYWGWNDKNDLHEKITFKTSITDWCSRTPEGVKVPTITGDGGVGAACNKDGTCGSDESTTSCPEDCPAGGGGAGTATGEPDWGCAGGRPNDNVDPGEDCGSCVSDMPCRTTEICDDISGTQAAQNLQKIVSVASKVSSGATAGCVIGGAAAAIGVLVVSPLKVPTLAGKAAVKGCAIGSGGGALGVLSYFLGTSNTDDLFAQLRSRGIRVVDCINIQTGAVAQWSPNHWCNVDEDCIGAAEDGSDLSCNAKIHRCGKAQLLDIAGWAKSLEEAGIPKGYGTAALGVIGLLGVVLLLKVIK